MSPFDGLGRKRKTHCKYGHQFDGTEKWSVNWKGYRCRVCRECSRLRIQRKRENPEFKALGAAATARWRTRNPEKYKAGYTRSHDEKKQLLLDARKAGCIRCGEKHPSCLDFHHRAGKVDKLGNLGTIRRFSVERILAEITKCDVLCANCHRKYHYDERQDKLSEGV